MKALLGKSRQVSPEAIPDGDEKVVTYESLSKDDAVEKMYAEESKEQVDAWYDALDAEVGDEVAEETELTPVLMHDLATNLSQESTQDVSRPASRNGLSLAEMWALEIMQLGEQHCENGVITVHDMQTFLPGSKFQRFLQWLIGVEGQTLQHDIDLNGTFNQSDIQEAVEYFFLVGGGAQQPKQNKPQSTVAAERTVMNQKIMGHRGQERQIAAPTASPVKTEKEKVPVLKGLKRPRRTKAVKPVRRSHGHTTTPMHMSPEVRAFLLKHAAAIHSSIEKIRAKGLQLQDAGQSTDVLRTDTDQLLLWLANGAKRPRELALLELCAAFPSDLKVSQDGRHIEILELDVDDEELHMWQRATTPLDGRLPRLRSPPDEWGVRAKHAWRGHPSRYGPRGFHDLYNPDFSGQSGEALSLPPEWLPETKVGQLHTIPPLANAGLVRWQQYAASKTISTGWAPWGSTGSGFATGAVAQRTASRMGPKASSPLPKLTVPLTTDGASVNGTSGPMLPLDPDVL